MLAIYRETECLPRRETYGLISQMRRAAISVPANLAEGSDRRSDRDFIRFARIAFGSLRELGYYIQACHDLGYWTEQQAQRVTACHDSVASSLCGLIRALES